ncbi:thiamine phosphate synthase [Yunchengibacter salinarum]|uniref:thiamine phosphate synthase n=1 Tax=Yunchengibacter salinarum TaxID=3133399 RepID=UPI0035B57586
MTEQTPPLQDRCGLYLITPDRIDDPAAFADDLAAGLAAGPVDVLQLRLKHGGDAAIRAVYAAIEPVCARFDVPILINDRADLAAELGADGVHLGQDDGDVATARALLGHDRDIGVTCHDSLHLAFEAGEAGADYVAFGAFYPSGTKERRFAPEPDLLSQWDVVTELPAVAIGGITPDNCTALARAGAHFVAVCGAVWQAQNGPAEAVAAFTRALDAARSA